ncbi:hypothetical protein DP092_10820 [Pseudomonas sp. MDMC224]|nr:hypothetical protein DP092_10820 [Pseudomonas sp. MDMC224]
MQTDFQVSAHRELANFAHRNQLAPYRLVESGNGTEYKNYLNGTVFTVYHDRLDDANSGQIEIAVGIENISTELTCPPDAITVWFLKTQKSLHSAESKSPLWWPRVAVWSLDEIRVFCSAYESLSNSRGNAIPMEKPQEPPPRVDERVMREILTRRGQSDFRSALLRAYGCRCAISTCADVDVLEAAHIIPHSDTQDYRTANGLLLRADLHTLFDLRLISIDPRTAKVVVSRGLGDTYQPLNGCVINLPVDSACRPDPSLLMHFNQWQANEQSNG